MREQAWIDYQKHQRSSYQRSNSSNNDSVFDHSSISDNNNPQQSGPSMPTNCALPRVDQFEFICLDALISKRTVQGTTENDSGSWETCLKHSSGSLLWQGRPASYLPLSPSHSYVPVAPILLFLLFVILPTSGKSERIIFIDPKDCGGSQEGHYKSPYRGDL